MAYGANKEEHTPYASALTGATATFSHDLIMTPFDTIKQRMQLGFYKSFSHCVREVTRVEGVRAFFTSLPTTLMMNLPHGSIVIGVNETMRKYFLSRRNSKSDKLSVSDSLISGSVAGGVAAMITTPLDVVKTRLQTQHLAPCTEQQIVETVAKSNAKILEESKTVLASKAADIHYDGCIEKSTKVTGNRAAASLELLVTPTSFASVLEGRMNMRDVIARIWIQEGAWGFFRGALPRMLSQAPAVAISWTVYETLKNQLNSLGL